MFAMPFGGIEMATAKTAAGPSSCLLPFVDLQAVATSSGLPTLCVSSSFSASARRCCWLSRTKGIGTASPEYDRSEQGHEPGSLEMPVVREGFRDAQPTHDDEGNVIDDASRAGQTVGVIGPSLIDISRVWLDQ